jgi:hypothetical protein
MNTKKTQPQRVTAQLTRSGSKGRAVGSDASLRQSKYSIPASRFNSANLELVKLNRKFATNRRL